MTNLKRMICLVLASYAASAVAADTGDDTATTAVDTSHWRCRYCAFEKGWNAEFELGGAYVSDDSFKFGEYTGLNKQGGYAVAHGHAQYRAEDAKFLTVDFADLGLDSRSLSAEGGQQGLYEMSLDFKQLPHYLSDTAMTPFLNAGTNVQPLPTNWVAGGATTAMPMLSASLHSVDIDTKRTRLGLGAVFTPASSWHYAVQFHRETKDGSLPSAGTFFFSATQLVQPVNYRTDDIEASAAYTGKKLQARFVYSASIFRDSDASLIWQNPYTPLFGANLGQLATPPDNQFHQVSAGVAYQFTERTGGTADIAFGRMTQDASFLPSTLNTSLGAPALPRNSLDGKVATANADLKLYSAVTPKLRLSAAYIYADRDNQTPQAAYSWVSMDMAVNSPIDNVPYSFTTNKLKLRADYRVTRSIHGAVGFDNDQRERTFQQTETTRENTYWADAHGRVWRNIQLTLRVSHGARDQSGFLPGLSLGALDNPLLTKYNMASRRRDSARLRVDTPVGSMANVGFGVDVARDDYPDSILGLIDDRDVTFSGDASIMLTKATSLTLFANREKIKSRQRGSQTIVGPDWTGENEDTVDYIGIGVKRVAVTKKLDVGADYALTNAHGAVTVATSLPTAPFPDRTSRRDSVKLYATYRLRKNISLRGAYWYENYTSDNWMLDGIAPNTLPTVLAFGELAPRYHVNVVTLSCQYKLK